MDSVNHIIYFIAEPEHVASSDMGGFTDEDVVWGTGRGDDARRNAVSVLRGTLTAVRWCGRCSTWNTA
ncbi:MAG: hypothetical protein ACI8S6_001408 [Myxococcota bacterium]|jgi:hypothetical protein